MITVVLFGSALGAGQKAPVIAELPQTDIPQPQFFCGYCHILTYPGVVQKGYELWKKGKHNKFGCVECHYPTKGTEQVRQPTASGTEAVSTHIPQKPPERFSYLKLGGETIRTRPRISDANCMTAACHGKPDDDFKTKKIKFTEKVPFVHNAHLEKKNQIEGQNINCTSCHQHETDQKKFEVAKATCHLCHFKQVEFNQDRGRCELCHALPDKPIQTSGEKPITHQTLKEAKVSCSSCHIELIQAAGGGQYEAYFEGGELKTALVLNAGQIKTENCRACHDQIKVLEKDIHAELMHQKHVTVKNARCLDCHQPILHAKADLDQPVIQAYASSHLHEPMNQPKLPGCAACHPEPHRYQRLLSAGPKRPGVSKTPDFMYKVRTNCLGCHVEKTSNTKGQIVMKASAKTCVRCHTKDHKKMLKDWKTELADEIKYGHEVEQEALAALAEAKAKLPESQLVEARKMLKDGRENLNIVKFGNGTHNKKYSIMLIDAAITRFEDMIGYIEEGE
jgi:predicted CXXCH cytochrome family protein